MILGTFQKDRGYLQIHMKNQKDGLHSSEPLWGGRLHTWFIKQTSEDQPTHRKNVPELLRHCKETEGHQLGV
jgi:hypothetical protein